MTQGLGSKCGFFGEEPLRFGCQRCMSCGYNALGFGSERRFFLGERALCIPQGSLSFRECALHFGGQGGVSLCQCPFRFHRKRRVLISERTLCSGGQFCLTSGNRCLRFPEERGFFFGKDAFGLGRSGKTLRIGRSSARTRSDSAASDAARASSARSASAATAACAACRALASATRAASRSASVA